MRNIEVINLNTIKENNSQINEDNKMYCTKNLTKRIYFIFLQDKLL